MQQQLYGNSPAAHQHHRTFVLAVAYCACLNGDPASLLYFLCFPLLPVVQLAASSPAEVWAHPKELRCAATATAFVAAPHPATQQVSSIAAVASATADAFLAPLLQQPEAELAAGSSINSPRPVAADQLFSRAAALAERWPRAVVGQMLKATAGSDNQQQSASSASPLQSGTEAAVTASCLAGVCPTQAHECSSKRNGCMPHLAELLLEAASMMAGAAATSLGPEVSGPKSQSQCDAYGAYSSESVSCQSSFEADLAVAYNEELKLNDLLTSSSTISTSSVPAQAHMVVPQQPAATSVAALVDWGAAHDSPPAACNADPVPANLAGTLRQGQAT